MHKNNNTILIWAVSRFVAGGFKLLLICLCLFPGKNGFSQSGTDPGGSLIRFTSSNTSFPEYKRLHGYTYDSVYFDFSKHYDDSSVIAFVPAKFRQVRNSVDLVFWFHGWHNSIDTALNYYHLASQFSNADKNAILVLAEAAKDAPDSYGGKLEQTGVFKELLKDVLQNLRKRGTITPSCSSGNIILAGHSGAYRVIAFILQNGGSKINEVDLFDALYGETGKFLEWIKKDTSNRFINFYTNTGGGTDEVSMQIMKDLKNQNLPFLFSEEEGLRSSALKSSNLIFIHSKREHNDIIFNPDNFRLFLESSFFLSNCHN
jgi:hypothetical protein